jgi:hypothetical protein
MNFATVRLATASSAGEKLQPRKPKPRSILPIELELTTLTPVASAAGKGRRCGRSAAALSRMALTPPRKEHAASLEPRLDRMAPTKAEREKSAARPRDDAGRRAEAAQYARLCAVASRGAFPGQRMPPRPYANTHHPPRPEKRYAKNQEKEQRAMSIRGIWLEYGWIKGN